MYYVEARMKRPLILVLVLALSAIGARADRYDDCNQEQDLDRAIRGCTQIIERRQQESQENRALAYSNRGNAYGKKGDVDRAIADYTKAIELAPTRALAYYNRGVTYGRKGDVDRAIATTPRPSSSA